MERFTSHLVNAYFNSMWKNESLPQPAKLAMNMDVRLSAVVLLPSANLAVAKDYQRTCRSMLSVHNCLITRGPPSFTPEHTTSHASMLMHGP